MNSHAPVVARACAFVAVLALTAAVLHAQPTVYTDPIGDISPGVGGPSLGGGTLDIIKMEVSDTTNDIIFTMTVNGNVSTTDWGKFMIGIANMKTNGTTNGNGWARPINMIAGPTNGMTHWIGSWVDGGGGANAFAYDGTNWNGFSAPAFTKTPGTNSTLSYTVAKTDLGVTLGDTIIFDAYSSGGNTGDSAVDALANPNISITTWAGPYTSSGTNVRSYTLANSATLITNTVTFSVNMNAQQSIANFNPAFDIVSVAGSWNGFTAQDFSYELLDPDTNGIYEGTFAIPGVYGTSVPYKFAINTTLETIPNRNFPVGTNATPPPLILSNVFYNDIPGFRDVTFSVNMTVQEALGNYNGSNNVLVVGSFNNWDTSGGSGNVLIGSNGVFTGTISNIGGAEGANLLYKFFSPGMPNSGYESIADRQLTLGPIGSNQVLSTEFWDNQSEVREVTFQVNMTVQEQKGLFPATNGVVRLIGDFNGTGYATNNTNFTMTNMGGNIFAGTFNILGNQGATINYKFWSPNISSNNGYELIGTNEFQNRTFLLSSNGVPQTLPLEFWSNDDGGATFTNWAQGAPLNPTNLGLYAVGGASGPTANNSIPSVSVVTSNLLSLTAIVRTNNPNLTVIGRTTTNLTTGWTTNGVSVTNAESQLGVPFGTARQIFSVPRTNSNQFLGLEAVLQP